MKFFFIYRLMLPADVMQLIINNSSSHDRLRWLAVSKSWQAMILQTVKYIEELNYDEVRLLYKEEDYLALAVYKPDITKYRSRDIISCWKSACKSEQWPIIKIVTEFAHRYILKAGSYHTATIYKIRDQSMVRKLKAIFTPPRKLRRDMTYILLKLIALCLYHPLIDIIPYLTKKMIVVQLWAMEKIVKYGRLDVINYIASTADLGKEITSCVVCKMAARYGQLAIFQAYYNPDNLKYADILLDACLGGNETIIEIAMSLENYCQNSIRFNAYCRIGSIDKINKMIADGYEMSMFDYRAADSIKVLKLFWTDFNNNDRVRGDVLANVFYYCCYTNDIEKLRSVIDITGNQMNNNQSISGGIKVANKRGYKKLLAYINTNITIICSQKIR